MTLPPDDGTVDLYDWTVETLAQHGFARYELSNFAKSGFESRHNAAYWDRKNYKGFGLGACSFNGTVRFQNVKNLGKYLELLGQKETVIQASEQLTSTQIALEKIMLGLRQSKGLVVADYMKEATPSQQLHFVQGAEKLKVNGLIEHANDIIRLTPKGYALENEVALQLFSDY